MSVQVSGLALKTGLGSRSQDRSRASLSRQVSGLALNKSQSAVAIKPRVAAGVIAGRSALSSPIALLAIALMLETLPAIEKLFSHQSHLPLSEDVPGIGKLTCETRGMRGAVNAWRR